MICPKQHKQAQTHHQMFLIWMFIFAYVCYVGWNTHDWNFRQAQLVSGLLKQERICGVIARRIRRVIGSTLNNNQTITKDVCLFVS